MTLGYSLSPLLFSLYIWDIEKTLQESNTNGLAVTSRNQIHVLLFADDTVVVAPTPKDLKKKIEILETYFDSLELRVNLDKTKVVILRRGGRVSQRTHFTYKGENIQIVPEYVYLRITM